MTVQYTSYYGIPSKLRQRQPFEGNTMRAEIDANGIYRVYSYGTEIATCPVYPLDPQFIWITDRHYSRTQARHINLCKGYLPPHGKLYVGLLSRPVKKGRPPNTPDRYL